MTMKQPGARINPETSSPRAGEGNSDISWLLKGWRRGSESNRRIKVLQTSPLPLGYRAILNNCNAGLDRNQSGKCDFQTITARFADKD